MICPTCGERLRKINLMSNIEAWQCPNIHPFKEPLTLEQAVRLDCQPKSEVDAVRVSNRWRERIIRISNGETVYAD